MADFLLIHGAGHAAWVWDGVKGILEDDLRKQSSLYHTRYTAGKVLAPDLPGHGEKFYEDDPTHITFETCIEKLLKTIDTNKLKYPIIGAHSLSGLMGLELARRLVEKGNPPSAIVLVGAVVPDVFRNVMEMLPPPTRIALSVLRLMPGTPPESVKLHRELGLKLLCSDMRYAEASSQVLGRLHPIPLKPWDALPNPEALEPTCPVTYMLLKRDWFITSSSQKHMASNLKNATLIELDCGHEAPITTPQSVASALLQYAGPKEI
ncbi:alpha/beta hydrolase [SAR202 cluster bacterium AD-802-E10_MRT_200m]|nr:alpha/beta hydrolase [SAR202 cluster bacterium AD-802-E10_MRT_200m]